MTKSAWIELIIRYLASEETQEQKRRYHPAEVAKLIENVYNDIIYDICLSALHFRDYGVLDSYTKAYYVDVQEDTRRKEKYFTLPVPIIQLPKNRAIRMVCPESDQSDYFKYSENNQFAQLSKLDIFIVSDSGRYYVEGNKVYLNKRDKHNIPDKLLVKLVIPFDTFDDEDDIPMVGGKGSALYQGVIKLLLGKPQEDDKNDNSNKVV